MRKLEINIPGHIQLEPKLREGAYVELTINYENGKRKTITCRTEKGISESCRGCAIHQAYEESGYHTYRCCPRYNKDTTQLFCDTLLLKPVEDILEGI